MELIPHPPPPPAAGKTKRAPDVLWRLFRSRARTLAETLLDLIPTVSAADCRCKGRRCLACGGADYAVSFLVRPDDPHDYRRLLTGCFVVVCENAPPPPAAFDPRRRWSQLEIVRRSIETILLEQPSSSNLICCSYDKVRRSSAVVDELTSSKWNTLLRRVGDALMMYLLKYASIFLPLPRKKHHQIAGLPISNLSSKFSSHVPKCQHHQLAYDGSRKKRKRVKMVESVHAKQISSYPLSSEPSSNSLSFGMSNGSSHVPDEELLRIKCEVISKQDTVLSRKRIRLFRWQRQREFQPLVDQGMHPQVTCWENSENNDNSSMGLQNCICASPVQSVDSSHCLCCAVFQNEPKMNRNAEIYRQNIFYKSRNPRSLFPRKHLLYALKPNDAGASVLFNHIFRTFGSDRYPGTVPCLHSKNNCQVMSACLYHSLLKLLKSLIRETQYCRHLRLLDKHCPITFPYQDENDPEAATDSDEPSKCYCPKKQVVSFIWAICRRIVPSPLLGEPSNWRILRKNISRFIQLRLYEKFSLKECIYRLKISKFPLLPNQHLRDRRNGFGNHGITDIARHAILECWIFWLFAHLVSPIVQANFYVTESEHEKQEVLYYRKTTWQKLMREVDCMKDDRYDLLSRSFATTMLGNRSFGFSRARFRPKQNGFRILTKLQAPYKFSKSLKRVLHYLHVILKGLWTKEPEKLGSSVFDYNDVYRKLVPFLFLLRSGSSNMPRVFIVVSDVSKAFDSINHNKLLNVMKEIILDDVYTLEKFIQVISTKNSVKVQRRLTLAYRDIITDSADIVSQIAAQSFDSVLVKKSLSRKMRKKEINGILEKHIKCNVVQMGNKFYLQRVGIRQGSVLSSLLCSFYYGHMEREVIFPFLKKAVFLGECNTSGASTSRGNRNQEMIACSSKYLLLRLIDDFLFVSTSKQQASMFLSRLKRGFRDYNCCMNEEKYGLNFNMDDGQECQSNRVYIGKDGISFLRWSGLLVNCCTLEIQADYTRYLSSPLSSTLTVSCHGKVGHQLKEKLRSYLRPKCHPIFYDSNINSPGVVRLNIYQMFLLCAMKFVCHVSNLSILPKFSPKFCIKAIDASLRYMNSLIKRKMYSFRATFRPKYDVVKKDVTWLGLYAYIRVLKKKQSRYEKLIPLLRSRLKAYGKVDNISYELRYAIDDSHSSVLWSIKY